MKAGGIVTYGAYLNNPDFAGFALDSRVFGVRDIK
jgi:hypothetical protein